MLRLRVARRPRRESRSVRGTARAPLVAPCRAGTRTRALDGRVGARPPRWSARVARAAARIRFGDGTWGGWWWWSASPADYTGRAGGEGGGAAQFHVARRFESRARFQRRRDGLPSGTAGAGGGGAIGR